jgi:hypothetical protein
MILYSEFLYSIYLNSGELFMYFLVILTAFSIYNYKVFHSEFKFFLIFLIGISIFEISALILKSYFEHTHFINHPYAIFSLLVSSLFYSKIIKTKNYKFVFFFFIFTYLVLNFYQIYSNKSPIDSPNALPVLNILIIILSLHIQNKLSKSSKIKTLLKEPLFWINLGFLIINLFQLILKPIFNSIINISSDDIGFILGTIRNLGDPITYTLWAIGVYKLSTQPFRPVASLWP